VSEADSREARTLAAAERIATLLEAREVPSALIGAMALAVHGHSRATADVDLAVATDPYRVLRPFAKALEAEGFQVRLSEPDAQDSLGGVLTVTADDIDPVQVVNFFNPWAPGSTLGPDAIASAQPCAGSRLRVVDLPHLVALKLYAGGPKSEADVQALLTANEGTDLDRLRAVCRAHRLEAEFGELLDRIGPRSS